MGLGGIPWIWDGNGRRLEGQMSNLSGKPTFLSVLLNDSWVATYDPKQPLLNNKKLSEGGFGVSWWPGAESTRAKISNSVARITSLL